MGKIEWSEYQWNPLTGCTMVSPGCTNCYAMKMAHRFKGVHPKYEGTTKVTDGGKVIWTGQINLDEKALMEPLTWKKPRRVFVNSMSDLFHESVPFEFIDKVFAVMALTPHITYMVLTKRPERMAEYMNEIQTNRIVQFGKYAGMRLDDIQRSKGRVWQIASKGKPDYKLPGWPLPNVWLGTTVENQEQADKRIPELLKCPAVVRFLSCEPLLGPVDIKEYLHESICKQYGRCAKCDPQLGEPFEEAIDWVIAGGESGREARPVHPDWIRSLRDQCQAVGVPFFFKQWGEWMPWQPDNRPTYWKGQNGYTIHGEFLDAEFFNGDNRCAFQKIGKKAAGRLLDSREWNEFPVMGGSEGER